MKMTYRTFLTLVILFLFAMNSAYSQLSISNQHEYSHWTKDSQNIFENWTDFSYQYLQYSFNARLEIYKPPDEHVYTDKTHLVKEEQYN